MNIEAVVVTHNNGPTIAACLDSLLACHILVTVVDTASQDATVRIVKGYKKIRLIELHKNAGFASAANRGASTVNSEYIFFLNPDAVLPHDAREIIGKALYEHPVMGIMGFLLCDNAGQVETNSWGKRVTPLRLLTRKYKQQVLVKQATRVGWVSGGAMVVRRDVWEAMSGFDEQFFLYWEDVDLCRRAWQAGFSVWLYPHLRIKHQRGSSFKSLDEKMRFYDASADRYFRKHYSFFIWGTYYLLRKIYRYLGFRGI